MKEVAGTHIVVPVGEKTADFCGAITLNDVGAFLWGELEAGGATPESLLAAVLQKYEVDEAAVKADIAAFLNKVRANGFLEEDE